MVTQANTLTQLKGFNVKKDKKKTKTKTNSL